MDKAFVLRASVAPFGAFAQALPVLLAGGASGGDIYEQMMGIDGWGDWWCPAGGRPTGGIMKALVFAAALAGLACGAQAQEYPPPMAGAYTLDVGHTRLLFRVSHMGFSNYTAMFTDMSADLAFDPEAPEAMRVSAVVEAASVETHYPDPALDFNAVLAGPEFLDAAAFPQITFVSTGVVLTGPQEADVTGDFTLHGVTRPLVLKVRYNGGWGDFPMDLGARIGFSAVGEINRSEFGIGFGVPAPGSTLGVGDRVEIILEAEFVKPRG